MEHECDSGGREEARSWRKAQVNIYGAAEMMQPQQSQDRVLYSQDREQTHIAACKPRQQSHWRLLTFLVSGFVLLLLLLYWFLGCIKSFDHRTNMKPNACTRLNMRYVFYMCWLEDGQQQQQPPNAIIGKRTESENKTLHTTNTRVLTLLRGCGQQRWRRRQHRARRFSSNEQPSKTKCALRNAFVRACLQAYVLRNNAPLSKQPHIHQKPSHRRSRPSVRSFVHSFARRTFSQQLVRVENVRMHVHRKNSYAVWAMAQPTKQ